MEEGQQEPKNTQAQTITKSWRTIVFDFLLRAYTIASAVGVIFVGLTCMSTCPKDTDGNPQVRDQVVSFFLIVLGGILGLTELISWVALKVPLIRRLMKRFLYLFQYRSGRGMFMIIAGVLCLDSVEWNQAVAGFAIICGLLNIIASVALWWLFGKDTESQSTELAPKLDQTPVESETRSTPFDNQPQQQQQQQANKSVGLEESDNPFDKM